MKYSALEKREDGVQYMMNDCLKFKVHLSVRAEWGDCEVDGNEPIVEKEQSCIMENVIFSTNHHIFVCYCTTYPCLHFQTTLYLLTEEKMTGSSRNNTEIHLVWPNVSLHALVGSFKYSAEGQHSQMWGPRTHCGRPLPITRCTANPVASLYTAVHVL